MVKIPKISGNLIIAAIAIGGIALVVNQIRGAGKDLFGALPALDEGLRKSVEDIQTAFSDFKLPEIKLPEFSLPSVFAEQIPVIPQDPTQQTIEQQEEIFGRELTPQEQQEVARIDVAVQAGEKVIPTEIQSPLLREFNPPDVFGFGVLGQGGRGISESLAKELGLFDLRTTDLTQQQITRLSAIGEGITSVEDVFRLSPTREDILFARAFDLERPTGQIAVTPQIEQIPQEVIAPIPQIVSELPDSQQFVGGGPSFIGATIRENPIDTLSEVLQNFPELSASQAADFLFTTQGKILPSQVQQGLIDPDIRNIVAGVEGGGLGQMIPVSSTPLETLSIREAENIRAAQFTCEQFGLNCELVESQMA